MTHGHTPCNLYYTIEAHLSDEPIESCKRHRAQDLVDGCDDIVELFCDAHHESRHPSGWINLFYHSTADFSDVMKLGIIAWGLQNKNDVAAREAAVDAAVEWDMLYAVKRHIDKEPEQWLKDYMRQVLDERDDL